MYKVVIPSKVWLEIQKELEFWAEKNPRYAEKVAVELHFHLTETLVTNPGFGALKAKKGGLLYYLIQKQFKLVFEVDKPGKQVIVHYFFNTRKQVSKNI